MKILFLYRAKDESGDNRVVVTQGKSLEKIGVEIIYHPLTGKGMRTYLESITNIRKQLRNLNIDLVHAHYGISGLAGMLSTGKEPLLVSFMGSDLLGSHMPDGRTRFSSRVIILMNRLMARWICSFSIVKTEQMGARLMKKTPYKVIPNGVDLSIFFSIERTEARKLLGVDEDKIVVLFPADRYNPEKNYELAAAAVRRVNMKNVILHDLNHAGQGEMNLWLNAADLLLVTSFHEGSPNIVKEAMACNCPAVSTDVGDVRWLFGEMPGYYISPPDEPLLAVKIEKAIGFRRNIGFTEGRNRVIQLGLESGRVAEVIRDEYYRLTGESMNKQAL